MKNFELPAGEIAKADSVNALFDLVNDFDDCEPGESDVFPATWAISEALIKSYFAYKGVDIATVKMLDSEGQGDEKEFPAFSNFVHEAWSSSDLNPKSEDHYFEYGWSYNYTHIYELTINNKPALLFDIADGTSSTNFSMLQLIFAS